MTLSKYFNFFLNNIVNDFKGTIQKKNYGTNTNVVDNEL
jgi:hypothetical protein